MAHLVFVYGTLQTGERNFAKFMSEAKSLGPARTLEPCYLMGHHKSATSKEGCRTPGMVKVQLGGNHIEGELFEVSDDQLAALDILEDVGGQRYYREEIALDDGQIVWAYFSRSEESYEESPHIAYNSDNDTYRWKEQPGLTLV